MPIAPYLIIRGHKFGLGQFNGLYHQYSLGILPKRIFICRYYPKRNEYELLFRLKRDVITIGWGNTIQEIENAWNRWYMDVKPHPRRKRNNNFKS